jgi:hypothetical protein
VFYTSDLFLLLLLACIEMNKDKVPYRLFTANSQVLLAIANIFVTLLAPSTPRAAIGIEGRPPKFSRTYFPGSGTPAQLLEILLSRLVKFPGLDMRSHILTELAIYLFEIHIVSVGKATLNSVKMLGQHLIIKIFEQFPLARGEILASAFTVISEEPSIESKERYCILLEKIAGEQLFSLCDYSGKISDW